MAVIEAVEANLSRVTNLRCPKQSSSGCFSNNVGLEFTPLSEQFKTREQAEKAREKYPERLRKTIGLGVIRIKK
jgi:hypothetical protein